MPEDADLLHALGGFYHLGLITDVVGRVKGGKEANVYCCRAHPQTGEKFLAAKIYRPLGTRRFRRDSLYMEGRVILDARQRRAFRRRRKTATGRGVQSGMWINNEWQTLNTLHEAGADVPKPFERSGSAILMEYVGNGEDPAPMLHQVRLEKEEARPLFEKLVRNLELWLTCNRVHADLSAYNVLYWNGDVKVIDFPQAVDPRTNPSAQMLLARDVRNVCRYFARLGVDASASRLADDLWGRFIRAEL